MRNFLTAMIVWLCFLTQGLSHAESITGQVVDVADGDTLTIVTSWNETLKIRLAGVDCPETFQVHGEAAKQFLSFKTLKRRARIEPETIDQYGRTVGMVLVNGENINRQIVAEGHGWVFKKYCTAEYCADWLNLEAKAKAARIGLWEDENPTAPWDWRAKERGRNNETARVAGAVGQEKARGPSVGAVVYHGNQRSRVFHGSGCKDFNCKNCVVVLKSKEEAVAGGFRPHKECVE